MVICGLKNKSVNFVIHKEAPKMYFQMDLIMLHIFIHVM